MNTNLNGDYTVLITPELKRDYDLYLQAFQQSGLFRTVAVQVLSMTKETLIQNDNGIEFTIIGTNPRGVWKRSLYSCNSKSNNSNDSNNPKEYTPYYTTIQNAGGADVEAECWWEDNGTTHVSWVRNAKEGDFLSRRYLNEEGHYICESSFFHNKWSSPSSSSSLQQKHQYRSDGSVGRNGDGKDLPKPVAFMTWKFQRVV